MRLQGLENSGIRSASWLLEQSEWKQWLDENSGCQNKVGEKKKNDNKINKERLTGIANAIVFKI